MNYQTLTEDEKLRLVEAVKDEVNGRHVEFDEFREIVGLFSEDIPGLESLSSRQFHKLVSECWSIYRR